MQALTGPELAKVVTFDGQASPVVTDGPYIEVKEVLAGYQLIDVETEARAIEDLLRELAPQRPRRRRGRHPGGAAGRRDALAGRGAAGQPRAVGSSRPPCGG
jgi:hypothetical protein